MVSTNTSNSDAISDGGKERLVTKLDYDAEDPKGRYLRRFIARLVIALELFKKGIATVFILELHNVRKIANR